MKKGGGLERNPKKKKKTKRRPLTKT